MTTVQPELDFAPTAVHLSRGCRRLVYLIKQTGWRISVLELNRAGFGSALGRRLHEIRDAIGDPDCIVNTVTMMDGTDKHSTYTVPLEFQAALDKAAQ